MLAWKCHCAVWGHLWHDNQKHLCGVFIFNHKTEVVIFIFLYVLKEFPGTSRTRTSATEGCETSWCRVSNISLTEFNSWPCQHNQPSLQVYKSNAVGWIWLLRGLDTFSIAWYNTGYVTNLVADRLPIGRVQVREVDMQCCSCLPTHSDVQDICFICMLICSMHHRKKHRVDISLSCHHLSVVKFMLWAKFDWHCATLQLAILTYGRIWSLERTVISPELQRESTQWSSHKKQPELGNAASKPKVGPHI